jgi:hypothetical protein
MSYGWPGIPDSPGGAKDDAWQRGESTRLMIAYAIHACFRHGDLPWRRT